ncbi:expressed unknown protein [Seminavis robusta]|uniref:Uncharacterized protein n=1 Tax=Seminavis robusta TaxID=568900 RepID=A0A9N8H5X0_9STRA|nr:expressed unknown protein [Seminavis robusta]|eukprot:Sro154_g070170.1 n/a (413) ;mRNA; r:84638-85876
MMLRPLQLALFLALATVTTVSATAVMHNMRRPLRIGFSRALLSFADKSSTTHKDLLLEAEETTSSTITDLDSFRGGSSPKVPALYKFLYAAAGIATTAAWSTVVYTTIRSNQPMGALMPTWQHGFFARIGALSAAPLILTSYGTLIRACRKNELQSNTARRHNLALAAAGIGSALWVWQAPLITKIPGTDPLQSHQAYQGMMKQGLMAAYGLGATVCGGIWAKTASTGLLQWPQQICDGVAQGLVSLAPQNRDDPVQVKYSVLASGFLFFTGLQLVSTHPTSVIPSWTGRRLARAFPAWTLLAAVTSLDLKEATERGALHLDQQYRLLANGLKSFGVLYLSAKVGAIFVDPSFPASYHAVELVPGWAVAAIVFVGLTLRSDGATKMVEACPIPTNEEVTEDEPSDMDVPKEE